MLESILSDVLLISVSTSLMIIGLLLLSPALSKHYSAKWKYGVWLIVTIRLMFPFTFSFGDSLVSIPLPESSRIETVFQGNSSHDTEAEISAISQPLQQDAGASNHTPSLMKIMALFWLAGASLFLLYHVMSYRMFRKQALRWSNPLLSDRIVSKINQVSNEMNVKCSIIVLTSRTVPNPMLVGFYKPILFLPHDQYRDEDLEFIMKHELVHYKRHDIVYKLMLLIVQAIHWFNPFVWLMVREAGREIEICCDDAVVRKQDLAYRKRYCEAILSAMEHNTAPHIALITNFSGGKHTMKQRFRSILNTNEKRNGVIAFMTVFLLIGSLAILVACTNIGGRTNNAALEPGTIYSYNSSGEQVAVNDTGNSYKVDSEGNVSISYQNGAIIAKTPLKLDTTETVLGMGRTDTGFFISEEKTAIVYGFADGNESPLYVLVSEDRGETWNEYTIEGAKGYDAKFIGFTNKQDGWIVAGGSAGVGHSLNYVYQTSDGGKTWQELGNPNDLYAEHLTGAGFANKEIGFLGFRYYEDSGPVIYWTKDKGESWEKLVVSLPETFDEYQKTPLSPIFNGKEGLLPILLQHRDNENLTRTIYLSSKDSGLTWTYDATYDKVGNAE